MARLLFIAKLNRDIDLEEVISNYEFSATNYLIMQPDGSIIMCTNKSELLHILENLSKGSSYQEPDTYQEPYTYQKSDTYQDPDTLNLEDTVLIIDGMCIVNKVISVACPKSCKDLADVFVIDLKGRSRGYERCGLIFDNYDRPDSLKDYLRHGVKTRILSGNAFHIVDTTPIQNSKIFLVNNKTKDALTIYLADEKP